MVAGRPNRMPVLGYAVQLEPTQFRPLQWERPCNAVVAQAAYTSIARICTMPANLTIRLPDEQTQQLARLAESTGRSRAFHAEEAIRH